MNSKQTKELIDNILYGLALCNIDNDIKCKLDEDILKLKHIYLNIDDIELYNLAIKILFAYEINEFIKFELYNMVK